jgi:hypothetical protein
MSADVQEMTVESIKAARDRKLAIVLRDKHPAWIVSETVRLAMNDCLFDVVFRYGGHWAQRRYIYDAEVDVLHFDGETAFDETRLHTLPGEMLFQPPT